MLGNLIRGRIRDVDPTRWTVDVQLENEGYLESVPIMTPYFHQEEGEGISCLPEVGAHCIVATVQSRGQEPLVVGFMPLRSSESDNRFQPEDDHSAGRGSATPGDLMLHGRDGNFIRVRRGGLIEIGSTELCRSQWFPVGDLIRHVCMNYEVMVGGSYGKLNVLDDPEIPTEGPTPVQLDIMVQEYAEKAPLVDFKVGHIVDDESRQLAGAGTGTVVTRFLVFNQATVDAAEQAGLKPSADQAVCALRFDRLGNAEQILSGQYLLKAGSRRLFLTGNDVQLVAGSRSERITGNLSQEVGGDVVESARGSRTIESRGPLILSGERIVFDERRARSTRQGGDDAHEVGGNRELSVAGNNSTLSGGGDSSSCVLDRAEFTGGKHVHTIAHAAEPTSMLQGALASLLHVLDGTIRQHAQAGNVEFRVGPADAPVASIKISGNPTRPAELGRVEISWLNPEQSLVIDGLTGHVRYKNSLGSWEMDPTGRTRMGTRGVVAGNVVTTMTHPVCYVTGAPILGCPAVQAAGGPPSPGPGAPLTPLTESAPDTDVPRP